jgi:hypothetical protein
MGSPVTYVGVCVRMSTSANTKYVFFTDGTATAETFVRKVVAGTETNLFTVGVAFTAGDVLRLEVSGTTLTAYKHGVSVGSGSDSAIASGNPGIAIYNATGAFDDFEGGDLAAGGSNANLLAGKFGMLLKGKL